MNIDSPLRGLAGFTAQLNSMRVSRFLRSPYIGILNLLEHLYPYDGFWQERFVRCLTLKTAKNVATEFSSAGRLLTLLERELWRRRGQARRGEIRQDRVLYVLCSLLKPEVVVETGVASGLSSCYILKSMAQRASGKLISIDLPNYTKLLAQRVDGYPTVSVLPKDKQAGWLIPDDLRDR